jgi:hypothetical protein
MTSPLDLLTNNAAAVAAITVVCESRKRNYLPPGDYLITHFLTHSFIFLTLSSIIFKTLLPFSIQLL